MRNNGNRNDGNNNRTLASQPTPLSAMANQHSAHARIRVADVLEPVESGMAYEAIIEEWRYAVTSDAIAEAVRMAREAPAAYAPKLVSEPIIA